MQLLWLNFAKMKTKLKSEKFYLFDVWCNIQYDTEWTLDGYISKCNHWLNQWLNKFWIICKNYVKNSCLQGQTTVKANTTNCKDEEAYQRCNDRKSQYIFKVSFNCMILRYLRFVWINGNVFSWTRFRN